MGLIDELRKLTQPYDQYDDNDESAYKPASEGGLRDKPVSAEQQNYESSFGPSGAPEPAAPAAKSAPQKTSGEGGGLFGARKNAAPKPKPQRERTVSFEGSDQRVVLFNPRDFNEAGELAGFLRDGRQVLLTLENVPTDFARRLLDFMSGIAFALDADPTPVSAKTYFVARKDMGMFRPGEQKEQPLNEGESF